LWFLPSRSKERITILLEEGDAMNAISKAFRHYFYTFGRRARPQGRPLAEPEASFGRPVPMTGLWATLSDEQRAFVIAYKGSQNVGDPEEFTKP
jgi:hypothetical protein